MPTLMLTRVAPSAQRLASLSLAVASHLLLLNLISAVFVSQNLSTTPSVKAVHSFDTVTVGYNAATGGKRDDEDFVQLVTAMGLSFQPSMMGRTAPSAEDLTRKVGTTYILYDLSCSLCVVELLSQGLADLR